MAKEWSHSSHHDDEERCKNKHSCFKWGTFENGFCSDHCKTEHIQFLRKEIKKLTQELNNLGG